MIKDQHQSHDSPLPTPKLDFVDDSKHNSSVLVKSVDAEALDAAEETIVSSQEFTCVLLWH